LSILKELAENIVRFLILILVFSTAPLFAADTAPPSSPDHWAWQPVVKPTPPRVRDKSWSQSPIDRFIYAKLKENGLKPSERADSRTLVRRARFDLLGLPPRYDEVRAVETSRSPDAWSRLVDRYLAMPEYGERWGRHWLDVARYADTKGYVFEEEERFSFSYTYRDYVIDAFNDDVPFNRFIVEQIAADKLTDAPKKSLAGMGFLTVGDRFRNGKHEIIDDQIDVVTRGFMGLTVACARCHHHKYDPIPIEDYYSMYGVFASSEEPPELPVIGKAANDAEYQKFQAEMAKRRAVVDKKVADIAVKARKQVIDQINMYVEEVVLGKNLKGAPLRRHSTNMLRNAVNAPSAEQRAVLLPLKRLKGLPDKDYQAAAAKEIATFAAGKPVPVNPHVLAELKQKPLANKQDLAAAYTRLFGKARDQWRDLKKKDGKAARLADDNWEQVRQILYSPSGPISLPDPEMRRAFGQSETGQVRNAEKLVNKLIATHAGAPPRAMLLNDRARPYQPTVFERGDANRRGKKVPRQFLAMLSGDTRKPFDPKGSGRLELAQAVADGRNPLTARVIVNRVWQWHFGTGLVESSSNFGVLGEAPSHPLLLDFLAATFVENGWSVKDLHRQIMNSETYRQASAFDAKRAQIDPQSRLLWRYPPRRLEFEPTRDALLAVSGKLDRRRGGHSVDLLKQPYTSRRSVYGFFDRLNPPKILRDFDVPGGDQSTGVRSSTTVPQQALFMVNSPFVIEQAKALATRVEKKHAKDSTAQVDFLYKLALARPPTANEARRAQAFLAGTKGGKFAPLAQLSQVVLCSNEFVFID
jgi:hypothetical protein